MKTQQNVRKNSLAKAKKGAISVAFAILLPILLNVCTYFCGRMEARFIAAEVQNLMDISTKAGASTGIIITRTVNGKEYSNCVIPVYGDERKRESGPIVTTDLLLLNIKENTFLGGEKGALYTAINEEIKNKRVGKLTSDPLLALGIVNLRLSFTYTTRSSFYPIKYRFNLESTSKCTVE